VTTQIDSDGAVLRGSEQLPELPVRDLCADAPSDAGAARLALAPYSAAVAKRLTCDTLQAGSRDKPLRRIIPAMRAEEYRKMVYKA